MATLGKRNWLGYVLVAVLAYLPLFYHLDQEMVRLWDESRVAVNAIEMDRSGDWLVTTFEGKPDHWHTKPPLAVWLITLSMKVFGHNTLAIRLPVALASLGLAFCLYWFVGVVLKRPTAGIFSVLALLTLRGFVETHVARTGDVDGLLLFGLALTWFPLLTYVLVPERARNSLIWVASAGFAIALMSKSSAALLTMPGLLVCLIWLGKESRIWRNWRVYVGALLPVILMLAYFLMRNQADPGYLQAVWENDFFGRLTSSKESNIGAWHYYLVHLASDHLFPYIYLLPLLLAAFWWRGDGLLRKLFWAQLILTIPYLLLISLASTKLEWYDAQLYPFVAIAIGIGLASIWELAATQMETWTRLKRVLILIMVCLGVFGQNYYWVYRQHTSLDSTHEGAEKMCYAMETIHREAKHLQPYRLGAVEYNASAQFYATKYLMEDGLEFTIYNPMFKPSLPESKVLVCHPDAIDSLSRAWRVDTLWEREYGCMLLQLHERRPDSAVLQVLHH